MRKERIYGGMGRNIVGRIKRIKIVIIRVIMWFVCWIGF